MSLLINDQCDKASNGQTISTGEMLMYYEWMMGLRYVNSPGPSLLG
jgi:hypothetical protein